MHSYNIYCYGQFPRCNAIYILQLHWPLTRGFNLLNGCKAINRENPGTQNTLGPKWDCTMKISKNRFGYSSNLHNMLHQGFDRFCHCVLNIVGRLIQIHKMKQFAVFSKYLF